MYRGSAVKVQCENSFMNNLSVFLVQLLRVTPNERNFTTI